MISKFFKKIVASFVVVVILTCTLFTSAGTNTTYYSNALTKANMPTTVYAFASATVDGKIYTFGGNSEAQAIANPVTTLGVTTVQMYNPSTNTWTTKASMPTARRLCTAAVVDGIIYVIGGSYKANSVVYGSDKNEAYNPATNTWTTKASLPVALHGVSSAVVDGKIYAIGGATIANGSGTRVNTVYMYDPTTDVWTQKASMSIARETSAVAVDGKIYAIGGFNGTSPSFNILSSVEMYNPGTNTWSTMPSMITPRFGENCIVIGGIIYAVGGFTNSSYSATNTIEKYNTETNTWIPWDGSSFQLSLARGWMGASVIDNNIYVFGGMNASTNLYNRLEQYVPSEVTLISGMEGADEGAYAFASATFDGKIYTFGGNTGPQYSSGLVTAGTDVVQMNNPSVTDLWVRKASMPTARRYCAAAVVDGIIYVIGGSYRANSTTFATNKNEAYNPVTNTWTTKASMPVALHGVSAGVVDGKIYVIGGATISNGAGTRVNTVYMYNPSTDIWTQKASMTTARETTTVVANGMIYAIGGFNGTAPSLNILSSVEKYNPGTNTWSTMASMGTARFGEECMVKDGKIYAMGGYIDAGYTATNTIEYYDVSANTWNTSSIGVRLARGLMGSSVIENSLYIFAGFNSSLGPFALVEKYDITKVPFTY